MKKYKIGMIVENERKKTVEKTQPDWSSQAQNDEK